MAKDSPKPGLRLTRKLGEEVVIGDNLFLLVEEIGVNKVKLRFIGGKNTTIYRREIWEQRKKGQRHED